ncbi:hypothetical protein [Sphingomonas sp. PR090111-T3T-6A]|nr:hypothetical protein [Sphingomonas sp. PR090111-T3T-6A]
MSQWPFVIAAYAVAIGGTLTLALASFVAMRKAERAAEALKRR